MVKVKVVVVILSAFFILSEATVTVEVISGLSEENAVECGQNDVIKCAVNPFPGPGGLMAWTTDSKPLIQCYDGSDDDCSSLSVDHYQFSSKLSEKTFNLTFNTVKLSDGLVKFRCTDTVETDTVTPNVAVLPDNATTLHSSSGLELEVTTGCVYPFSAVTFKWYYMVNGARVNFDSTKSEETIDSTGCTTGDCGGADVKKITSRLTTDSEGEEYSIHVDVIHAYVTINDPNYVVSKSLGMFKVAAPTVVKDGCPGLGNSEAVDSTGECACAWFGICCAIIVCTISIGLVIELIFALWGDLGNTAKIVLCIFIIGFGFVIWWAIRRTLATNESGGNDPTNKSSDDILLNKKQSHVMNTKYGRTRPLSTVEGGKVTLSCPFPESVTYPEWRGPTKLMLYTKMNDQSGEINSNAPAFERLQYASNKRDLILSNAVTSDSGDYTCSYTGQGNHTIVLKVNPANCTGGIDLADKGQLLQENPV